MFALPPGALRVVHLSDSHLSGDGSLHQGSVDTLAALDRVLAEAARVDGVRLLVGSGDLSDDGSTASYALLRDRLEAWAASRDGQVDVVLVPGNHDLRAGFTEVLGDGHLAHGAQPCATEPVDGVSLVDGWRVVTLDTSVPRAGYGLLRPEQLDRLRDLLAEPAPRGSVVVLHHPPLPAPTTLHESLALQAPEALAEALEGTDVRVVLAGHYHRPVVGSLAGVPVLAAPAVANETDVCAPHGTERAVRGSGFLIVDLLPDGSVRSTPVRVHDEHDGAEVFVLDEEAVRAIAVAAGAPAPA
ncbi:calcineurin-like phosphoesterase family protein [Frigoribacterium sp. PhB107]|uniref:metallophosphoesterase n=1 Tax=Frigoribacterium sp. PhB107 TaxID=2485172 RepID=UPI000F4679AD|nr:metallophosphoesterase [Frigoribacterium sp. PhB107]ROP78874.1 calcineurin-like phosphoesterase family protein [Frigoribacterium sp. PhB107]